MNLKLKALIMGIGIIISIISGCVEESQQNNNATINISSSDITTSPSVPFFPVQKNPSEMCATVEIEGELIVDDNGCIRINDMLIVWPYGFSLITDEEGVIQVIDDTGKPIVRVGDKIKSGGGGGELPDEEIAKYSAQLPYDRCAGPYWFICKRITSD